MAYTIAPAAKAALSEATHRWPRRSRACDGTIGDTAHSSRTSDHNPNEYGEVLAFDLTHDPAAGCDAHALVRAAVARRDRRIKYAISEGRIWSRARAAEGWRPYAGSNRHDKHAHVSVDRRWRNDTSPWWATAPAQPAPREDDLDMDEKRLRQIIGEELDRRVTLLMRGEQDGKKTGHTDTLRGVRAAIDALDVPRKAQS
jgi:hypothetical protein